jgi:hypothetical protein
VLFDRGHDAGRDFVDVLDGADKGMVPIKASIAWTTSRVAPWNESIRPRIWSVERAVWSARRLTSLATTAKPRPASPARAASMVAFRASRWVWEAISVIMSITSPIFWPDSASSWTLAVVCDASSAACCAIDAERLVWAEISPMVALNSLTALATVCTFSLAADDAR